MTSILYICNKNDVFLKAYIRHLDPGKYHIQILALAQGEFIDVTKGIVNRIVKIQDSYPHMIRYFLRYICALLFMLRYAGQKFDVIHVLNIKRENFYLIPFLRKRCHKIIITVYGRSTYLYPSKRILFAGVYKFVDVFIFSNRSIIKDFSLIHYKVPASKLIENVPLMSSITLNENKNQEENIQEFINKYNINKELIRISCSSTISSNDQHDKVIEAVRKLKGKKKVQLMFLLTYGGTKKEQQRISDKIKSDLVGFNVRMFTSFLTNSELDAYRAITDIYINMRSSDQLAGAMLESLYKGALLISGKWLNYETLDNLGIHYKKVNGFNELASIVDENIEEFDEYKRKYSQANSRIIADTYAVEVVLNKWETLYKTSLV